LNYIAYLSIVNLDLEGDANQIEPNIVNK